MLTLDERIARAVVWRGDAQAIRRDAIARVQPELERLIDGDEAFRRYLTDELTIRRWLRAAYVLASLLERKGALCPI